MVKGNVEVVELKFVRVNVENVIVVVEVKVEDMVVVAVR